jgi:predicted carbohydrate-binding protein with CBM5 and CBM33 domain
MLAVVAYLILSIVIRVVVISNRNIGYINAPANRVANVRISLGRSSKDSVQVFFAQAVRNSQSANENTKILKFPDKCF